MKAGTRRRHIKAAKSLNDIAVTAMTAKEKQTRTEGQNYNALDRLIDSLTRDFSKKRIISRLIALAKKDSRNVARICNHLHVEQTKHNIRH